MVTHTDRFCRRFLETWGEIVKQWGAWLRAPPRRVAGQVKSKWLRDGGDDDWESKNGRSNSSVISGRVVTEEWNQGQNFRGKDKASSITDLLKNSNKTGGGTDSLSGPGEEELDRLAIMERKRRRETNAAHEVNISGNMEGVKFYNNLELYNTEASLSAMDYAASSPSDLAKLARQASHPQ